MSPLRPRPASSVLPALLLVLALLPGCVATTNYYTGRTAENGAWRITPGLDNLIIANPDEEELFIEKNPPFLPSFGAARGLPRRFEVGARYYLPVMLEGNLRWQATPRSMERFAASLNLHYGAIGPWAGYLKYGGTVSTDIWRLRPIAGFYFYDTHSWNAPDDDWEDILATNRVLTLGIGIEIPGGLLIPEVNYQYPDGADDEGFLFFGIGLRVGLDLPEEEEPAPGNGT